MATIIDLELTDTDIDGGGRIVSLGAVRVGLKPADDLKSEWFFNPEDRKVSEDAFKIHGLSDEFLATQKTFRAQYFDIALFLGKSRLIHHCWYRKTDDRSVDERALNAEFKRAGQPETPHDRWVNLKKIAQGLSPNANSLNDMMDRFGIDKTRRGETHGALIDAILTTEVLRAMQTDRGLKRQMQTFDLH